MSGLTCEERLALRDAATTVQAAPALSKADKIIAAAHAAAAHLHDQRDRLAYTVGWLQGEIRSLCAELNQYEPQPGAGEIAVPVMLDMTEAIAVFDADDGDLLAVHMRGANVLGVLSYTAIDDCQAAFEAWKDAQRDEAAAEQAEWRAAA